jgi:hypothetical protein
MSNDLMLDVGQANELKMAFRAAGFSNALIKEMCRVETMFKFKYFLQGNMAIKPTKHIIDCDLEPSTFSNNIIKHNRKGIFNFHPDKVDLYIPIVDKQNKFGDLLYNQKVRKANGIIIEKENISFIKNNFVLNANVLDYLLIFPEIIPNVWKEKERIFFFGTLYKSRDWSGSTCVRGLIWDSAIGKWRDGYDYLFSFLPANYAIAIYPIK